MPLPVLPDAPQPADKTTGTFSTKASAWVAALPGWPAAAHALELTFTASNLAGVSTSSVAIGTGAKSFTASTGKAWAAGTWLVIADASNAANYMVGTVTSYNAGTGALVVNVTATGGSGTLASWSISITSPLSQAPTVVSLNGGQLAGTRNVLTNGDFRIDQRYSGAAITVVAGTALGYTVDRWYAACTGANVTGQRVAGSGASLNTFRFTGAVGCTGITFAQRVEAADSYFLAGQTATLSVSLTNSLLTSCSWAVYYANTADSFGTVAAPTRTLIASGSFAMSATEARRSASFAVPAAATTGLEIVLSVGAQSSGTWVINEAQVEIGGAATPFERRPIQAELARCQRYYEAGTGRSTTYTPSAGTFGASSIFFAATKRVVPTVTFAFIPGSSSNISGANVNSATNNGVGVDLVCVAGGSGIGLINYTASAEL